MITFRMRGRKRGATRRKEGRASPPLKIFAVGEGVASNTVGISDSRRDGDRFASASS